MSDRAAGVARTPPAAGAATGTGAAPASAAGTAAPAVVLEGLERRYGDRLALAGISLTLGAGRTLAVLGPNGAGKTTLLGVLATLLRPHAGSALVAGARLPGEADAARRRIGYLGHEPLLYRHLSARENLRFYARLYGVAPSRVDELIDAVGMGRRAAEPVRDLSRGMVQRLAAARAVLHDPQLLLLDEPRTALDPAAAERLEPLIGRGSGRARVLATHDVEGGLAECDLALGLRRGRTAFLEPPERADARAVRTELYG